MFTAFPQAKPRNRVCPWRIRSSAPRFLNKQSILPRLSAISLALLLVTSAASGQPYPWDKDPDLAETVLAWMKEVEAVVRTRSDPLGRTIVCRVPYTDIVITSLALATKTSRVNIMRAASRLESMELVKISNNSFGQWTIKPASEEAREKMKRWAEDWCTSDENCEVPPKRGRKRAQK